LTIFVYKKDIESEFLFISPFDFGSFGAYAQGERKEGNALKNNVII